MHTLVILLLLASTASCQERGRGDEVIETTSMRSLADDVLYGMSHEITVTGIRQATLKADSAFLHHEARRMDLYGVVLYYGEKASPQATAKSERGMYRFDSPILLLEGSVTIASAREGIRAAPRLRLDLRTGHAWAPGETPP